MSSASALAVPGQPAVGARSGGVAYKWLVLMVVVFGSFISVLDSTIVNIAIPKLEAVFGVSLHTVQWVVTGYTLALTVSIPFFGWLADRIGTKRTYVLSLIIFTAASALCGLAANNTMLVAFRVLQGLGGGALLPLGTAQVFAVFRPEERGQAVALLGIPVLFAPALGPTVGGYLVDAIGWRLIFYINVPIGITGVILATIILREGRKRPNARLDIPGLICASSGFALITYGVTLSESDGWGALTTRGFLAAGALFVIALIIIELRVSQPLLDLRILKNRNFSSGLIVGVLLQACLFGGVFLLPVFLQNLRGQTALQAGLILLPSSLVTVLVLPIGGRLSDRIGAKKMVVTGALLLAVTNYLLSHLSLATPFRLLQTWLVLRSISLAFCLQPNQVASYATIPVENLNRATAFYNVVSRVGSAFGTAFLTSYLGIKQPLHFAHLAEKVTPLSPAGQIITGAVQRAQSNGTDVRVARAQATQLVVGQIQRQAAVIAYRDTFLIVTLMALVAMIVALVLLQARRRIRAPVAVEK